MRFSDWIGICDADIASLPRWGRVALAAHCARLVKQRHTIWLKPVLEGELEAIEEAISLAEQSGAAARPVEGLLEASDGARRVSQEVHKCFLAAREREHVAGEPAISAFNAALAATRPDSIEPICDAISSAFLVGDDQQRSLIKHSLRLLRDAANRERWSNTTPVSPRFFSPDSVIERQVVLAIHDLCVRLCELIARDGKALRELDWLLMEQVIAVALEGIGFEVECTPPSKDGGKDIVVTCVLRGHRATYYLEVKHWRSRKRVPLTDVERFVQVNLRDGTKGGLFLSTSDFANVVYSHLAEINEKRIALGNDVTVISLCQHFVQERGRALWKASSVLPSVLFTNTVHDKGNLIDRGRGLTYRAAASDRECCG